MQKQKPTLNPGYTIFFYSAMYDRSILIVGGGYGLTRDSCNFCVARSEREAIDITTASLNKQLNGGAFVDRMSVKKALQQDPARYVYPETHPGAAEGYTL